MTRCDNFECDEKLWEKTQELDGTQSLSRSRTDFSSVRADVVPWLWRITSASELRDIALVYAGHVSALEFTRFLAVAKSLYGPKTLHQAGLPVGRTKLGLVGVA